MFFVCLYRINFILTGILSQKPYQIPDVQLMQDTKLAATEPNFLHSNASNKGCHTSGIWVQCPELEILKQHRGMGPKLRYRRNEAYEFVYNPRSVGPIYTINTFPPLSGHVWSIRPWFLQGSTLCYTEVFWRALPFPSTDIKSWDIRDLARSKKRCTDKNSCLSGLTRHAQAFVFGAWNLILLLPCVVHFR